MSKLISIVTTFAVALSLASCGGNNQSQQSSDLDRREAELQKREDSLRIVERQQEEQRKQTELEEQKRQELETEKRRVEANAWVAPNGTKYDVEKLIKSFYQRGVQLGQHDKTSGTQQIKYFSNHGTEVGFKSEFAYNFGIPSDDRSKEIYNQGLKEYLRGYEDGWNF